MDKLQRAGRDSLMRLVVKHGLQGAVRVLADEIEDWRRASFLSDESVRLPPN